MKRHQRGSRTLQRDSLAPVCWGDECASLLVLPACDACDACLQVRWVWTCHLCGTFSSWSPLQTPHWSSRCVQGHAGSGTRRTHMYMRSLASLVVAETWASQTLANCSTTPLVGSSWGLGLCGGCSDECVSSTFLEMQSWWWWCSCFDALTQAPGGGHLYCAVSLPALL